MAAEDQEKASRARFADLLIGDQKTSILRFRDRLMVGKCPVLFEWSKLSSEDGKYTRIASEIVSGLVDKINGLNSRRASQDVPQQQRPVDTLISVGSHSTPLAERVASEMGLNLFDRPDFGKSFCLTTEVGNPPSVGVVFDAYLQRQDKLSALRSEVQNSKRIKVVGILAVILKVREPWENKEGVEFLTTMGDIADSRKWEPFASTEPVQALRAWNARKKLIDNPLKQE